MSFLGKLRGGAANTKESCGGEAPSKVPMHDAKRWCSVLAPALDRPYSIRGLEVACRLARTSGATLHLAYVMEVPRALALDASIPDVESLAESVLQDAEDFVNHYRIPVVSKVYRTRNAVDGIFLKLLHEDACDLLVLGCRPDEARGLPRELTRELFRSAPCEVVLDYIAGEQ